MIRLFRIELFPNFKGIFLGGLTACFTPPLSASLIVGVLQLQAPSVGYYYSREHGSVVVDSSLSQGDVVSKGQSLLIYETPEREEKRITSKTSGYVEYANSNLDAGYQFETGEMFYKVTSNLVLATYAMEQSETSRIQIGSKHWVCIQNTQWEFNVDLVEVNKLLISSHINRGGYEKLNQVSQIGLVHMFDSKDECIKSVSR